MVQAAGDSGHVGGFLAGQGGCSGLQINDSLVPGNRPCVHREDMPQKVPKSS